MRGRLVFAYMRSEFRQQGIGMEMIGELLDCVPGSRSIEVAYWTPDARAMAAHGIPIS
jgi:hypothetical protein